MLFRSAMQSCVDDADVAAVLASEANIRLANQFHRAAERGLLDVVRVPGGVEVTGDSFRASKEAE